jgi:cell division septation protein DedD
MAKRERVGLGLWDRLVLLLAWAVTCGLVYLLGVYVGKGTLGRQLGVEDRVVRLPVSAPPPPAGQRPKGESELGFYDQLMAGEARARGEDRHAARTPAPTRAPEAASPVPARTKEVVPPKEVAPPPPITPARPAPPPRPAAAPVAPSAPPVARAPAATPPRPAVPPAGAPETPVVRGGGWTVQANPTRSREEADALLRQLRSRGYQASVVRVLRDGDTWYRVQIGHFGSSEQASEVMQRLREQEGVTHAFVASE